MTQNKVYKINSLEDIKDLEDKLNYGDVLIWKNYNSKEKIFTVKGTTYYKIRKDAEAKRKSGDRVWYIKGLGYYIVKPKKGGFF